ncbi:MAG: uroporphyrinogen decarboxylase family protein [Dehalococcoidales bacterium]|nr:uroporphyrinogen decarboxylase family protein [Dehalococcoidales bacterium]
MTRFTLDGKTGKQLRKERETRIMDAIKLKPTDRVPVITSMGYFPAKYVGIPCSAAYYDFDAWYDAYAKTLPDFPADMIFPQGFNPGKALEILDPKTMRWPGHGVDPHQGHQAIEIDNLKADEYDAYMNDPSDFMFRIFISRVSNNLAGMADIPRLSDIAGMMGAQAIAYAFADRKISKAITTLQKAGREMRKWRSKSKKFDQLLLDLGFAPYFQGAAMPPFDVISHSMRGMTGTMMDMFRQPQKIEELCDFLLKKTLERPSPQPSENGYYRIFMTNTRGSDDFLSMEQFKRFYWPTFKTLVMGLIDKGLTPCIFFEGKFTSRLEYLLEFPKGSILARFDTTDIFRAKDVLKGHICIEGNVPSSLLQVGSKEDVIAHCKKLIDYCAPGGGYILSPRSSTDEVKPENLKAMIEFTKEYGKY